MKEIMSGACEKQAEQEKDSPESKRKAREDGEIALDRREVARFGNGTARSRFPLIMQSCASIFA